jgi:pimeloyl-ACP methyl ester carboxylesterase
MNPYQVGKIPIVLIHGTASNPAAWAQMLNGLLFDAELRRHYQFWFAIYDTGTPILYNAALIRASLEKLVTQYDPARRDPALSRMVLIGHSQGGLVARLLVTSSGDRFWGVVSKKPFDGKSMPEAVSELVRSCFFFEPLRYVQRVVFISTPHGGSFVASSWIGSLARRLVSLPGDLVHAFGGLTKGAELPPELRKTIPTSIQNMAPGSTFVKTLATAPIPPSVRLHSIIAVSGSGPVESGDDGVVRYRDAHIDQAESELVVRHGHSCQNEPETVLEVRRILREHLEGRKVTGP